MYFSLAFLLAALWTWGRFRNEYQESPLGAKSGRYVGLTNLPPPCADFIKLLGASTYFRDPGAHLGLYSDSFTLNVFSNIV